MLKVAVIIQNVTGTFNILQSDFEICNHVTAIQDVTAIYQNLQSCDCNFRNMTAKFEK